MNPFSRLVSFLLVLAVLVPRVTSAQPSPDVWRDFARQIATGTELTIRLQDGPRFRATLIGVRDDALLVQPKTRVPVPVQEVPYASVLSLAPRREGGMGAAKAAAIGVASGVGAFFAIMAIVIAAVED